MAAVHRPGPDDHAPRSVRNYWAEYDHELTASEPRPTTFHQYVTAGRKTTFETGEVYRAVDKIAEGIIRLARAANPAARIATRRRKHAQILDVLSEREELRAQYLALISALSSPNVDLATNKWDAEWCPAVIAIAGAVANAAFARNQFTEFLGWPVPAQAAQEGARPRRDNFFRYPPNNPRVAVRAGSIHSVKGETHTATLVLDTYFNGHHLQALKGWLLGTRVGQGAANATLRSRLKQHYVALTRPTHLLCLAMRDNFTPAEIETLKARAWCVGRLTEAGIEWL